MNLRHADSGACARRYVVTTTAIDALATCARVDRLAGMRKRIGCCAVAASLALIIWFPVARAADTLAYAPAPVWVVPQEVPVAPAGESGVPLRVLLTDVQMNLAPTVSETYFDNVLLIQTPQGLTTVGNIAVAWRPETDLVTIHKLRILRDGKEIDVLGAGQTFTILRREDQLEFAALSGVLTAVIQPEGLRVGDRVEFAYTLKRTDPLLGGTPEQIVGVAPASAPVRVHLRARWPADYKMTWRASKFLEPVNEAHADKFTEVSTTRNNDEPLVEPAGAPARFGVDRVMQFSGHKSWSEISKLIFPLFDHAAQLSRTSPLQAELTRIRAASPDPKVRAAAALRLVQDQIRYVYLGMNDARLVPADVETTWSRRYGDCKAKTALLLALLHDLGIEAEPVAVATIAGDAVPTRLPMIGLFNHVLVRATIAGKVYWLDGTRSGDRRLDDLSVPNLGWGLPLRRGGAELIRLEPAPLSVPMEETTIKVDASDGATDQVSVTAQTVLRGDSATVAQAALSRLTDKQRDTALRAFWTRQSYWADNWNKLTLQTVKADFDDTTGLLRISMDGQGVMNWQGDQHLLGSLSIGRIVDLKREPGPNSDAPYLVAFPAFSRVTEHIKLPQEGAGFEIVGTDIDRTVAGIHYLRTAQIKDGEFLAEASARSVQMEFPASEAAAAQVALRELWDTSLFAKLPEAGFMSGAAVPAAVDSCTSVRAAGRTVAATNAAAPDSRIDLLDITPVAGTNVEKDTVLIADLSYVVKDFSPQHFKVLAQFDTAAGGTTDGTFKAYPILPSAAGTVHFCFPLKHVWNDASMRWPLTVRFYLNKIVSGGSIVVAQTGTLVYPSNDPPPPKLLGIPASSEGTRP